LKPVPPDVLHDDIMGIPNIALYREGLWDLSDDEQ
jgi:hypothetical protein